ncbi:MAG: SAM-dependent methyltransferase [Peptococcaceae bacterium]|nr:SAM-dependent methyltransferase [Clostridia bacterium]MBQ7026461.1 SAM-dependent methyltransferase [Peptococcaceae bacterium]
MKNINLDERLKCAADFVRRGSVVADIGTDHGYLTAYLIQSGIISKALACDINKGPLDSAQKTMYHYNCADKVTLRLSDGLEHVQPNECDDIVIAGMGGELIVSIIDKAPWLKDSHYRLILQPMSKPEILRRYLLINGFDILDESPAFAAGRYYSVICAEFVGNSRQCDDFFAHIGKLCDKKDEKSAGYKRLAVRKLTKQANGLKTKDENSAQAKALFELIESIEQSI